MILVMLVALKCVCVMAVRWTGGRGGDLERSLEVEK